MFEGVLLAAFLTAGPSLPQIDRAQGQLESGDFEEAIKTVEDGIAQPDVTDDQLAELYRLLGLAELYLGNEDKAREAYEKLLQARPDYELPKSEPPKIQKLYARIKEDIKKRRVRPVTIAAEAIGEARTDAPLTVQARIEDLALGARAKLYYRRAGAQSYSSVDFTRAHGKKDEFTATLPAFELPSEPGPYEIEYYLEVADAAQRRLAGKGDSFNPLAFKVLPREAGATAGAGESHWYQSPWLWAGVGAVVIAGGAGVVLATSSHPTGTLPITITVKERF